MLDNLTLLVVNDRRIFWKGENLKDAWIYEPKDKIKKTQ